MLDACRAVRPPTAMPVPASPALPDVLVARYLGRSTEEAAYIISCALWQLLRPALLGRGACTPRIWST